MIIHDFKIIFIQCFLLGLLLSSCTQPPQVGKALHPNMSKKDESSISITQDQLSRVNIPFVENKGQLESKVKYYANTFAGNVYVTDSDIVYKLASHKPKPKSDNSKPQGLVLRESFIKANENLSPQGQIKTSVTVNSFVGKKENWRSGISTYNTINMGEVWNSIELLIAAKGNNIEKIFTVKPGGDPRDIALNFDGAQNLSVDQDSSELVVTTSMGEARFTKPVAYQIVDGKRENVGVEYTASTNRYAFQVGQYRKDRDLIIDPLLASTFVGAGNEDLISDITRDTSGNIIVAGYTYSTDFPTTSGAYDATYSGGDSIGFVTKLNSTLTNVLSSTFIGGNTGYSVVSSVTVDSSGKIFICGYTNASDYPTTGGAFDSSSNNIDVFISSFSADLSSLISSTFLGGSGGETSNSLAFDSNDNVVVVGSTESADFPTTGGTFDTSFNGAVDVFISKLNNDLTALVASTFVGGTSNDYSGGVNVFSKTPMRMDSSNNIFLAGSTFSTDFPTTFGSLDTGHNGNYDGYLIKLNSNLTSLLNGTFIGGSMSDFINSIAIDSGGNVILIGSTSSSNYPTTTGAYDISLNGSVPGGLVSKISPDFSSLVASTFLGGSTLGTQAFSGDIDVNDNIFVTGITSDTDFPVTTGAYQSSHSGTQYDVFISKFNSSLTDLTASTLFGPNPNGSSRSLILAGSSSLYISGTTRNSDIPTTSGAYRTVGTGAEGFIANFTQDLAAPTPTPTITATPTSTPTQTSTPTTTPTVTPTSTSSGKLALSQLIRVRGGRAALRLNATRKANGDTSPIRNLKAKVECKKKSRSSKISVRTAKNGKVDFIIRKVARTMNCEATAKSEGEQLQSKSISLK